MNRIVVDWHAELQQIDGFGVCGAFMQARNLQQYPVEIRTQVLDALFSRQNGAGISMIRNIVGDSGVWGDQEDGPTPSIMPQKGKYNDTGDEDQLWLMREAAQRGCDRFISSVWSTPAWMKTNAAVVNGGELKPENYPDFAHYLAEYVRIYKERHGITIYALSPANEPDFTATYSSCRWSGEQFARFYGDYLMPLWHKLGLVTLTFGPENFKFGNKHLQKYAAMFADPHSMPDIVAMHGYEDSIIEPLNRQLVGNRKVWMSELCEIEHPAGTDCDPSMEDALRVTHNVHRYLTTAGCSAYIYFWGASKYDNNSALIRLDLANRSAVFCKRLYAFAQYSRFIRPGYVRVALKHDCGEQVFLSAYKGEGNKLVIVGGNTGAADRVCRLDRVGFATRAVTCCYTNSDHNVQTGTTIHPDGNGIITLTLPVSGVATFTAECTDEL